MNVYVATSTRNLQAAKRARRTIRGWGHTVHSTWMDFDAGGRGDGELTVDERRGLATNCAFEVLDAHLVVALWHPNVFGAVIEVGLAIGNHIPVCLVGEWRESVFWSTGMTRVHRVATVSDVKTVIAMEYGRVA